MADYNPHVDELQRARDRELAHAARSRRRWPNNTKGAVRKRCAMTSSRFRPRLRQSSAQWRTKNTFVAKSQNRSGLKQSVLCRRRAGRAAKGGVLAFDLLTRAAKRGHALR